MNQDSLHWIDTQFRNAGNAACDISEYWEQFLASIELFYVYTCLERDRRHEETTMALGDTDYLVPLFEILWTARATVLGKQHSPDLVAERVRLLYEAVLTMPELVDYTEESKARVIAFLENPKITTAMFSSLLEDKSRDDDQIH